MRGKHQVMSLRNVPLVGLETPTRAVYEVRSPCHHRRSVLVGGWLADHSVSGSVEFTCRTCRKPYSIPAPDLAQLIRDSDRFEVTVSRRYSV